MTVLTCSLLLQPTLLGAEHANPHVWKSRPTSVAVFKNGLGFFVRDGGVKLRDGWCVAEAVPPAAFGTLAVYSLDEEELVDIVGSGKGEIVEFNGIDVPDDLETRRTRLQACRNLNVSLTYTHKGKSAAASGKLISLGPEFVILEAGNNRFAVPVAGVSKLQILNLPLRVHVATEKPERERETKLGMAYLRKGITWIPEYTVKVLDDKTAEITLRGTLVNEAEDLIHCDVNFVVGVPHFLHTDYLAPIAVGQVIRTVGAAVAPKQVRTQIANRAAMTSNMISSSQFGSAPTIVEKGVNGSGKDLRSALGNLPQVGGAAGTDYTVYTKKDLTVRRGEKAIVTLFVKKVTYSHIYRWSPPERMKHLLVLHNTTDTAWTTGPYLAISGSRPLSEDLLKYTPRGGNCEIPVTAAINVAHEKTETETERKLKAYSPSHNFYLDLVNLAGELKLLNFEKDTVRIVVTAAVPGKPTGVSEDGTLSSDSTKLKLLERTGVCRWVVELKTGESRSLTYSYERYVPSR